MTSTESSGLPTRGGKEPRFSRGEEIGHSVTHGVGIVLSITALTVLVAFACLRGTALHVTASAVFGVSLVLLYTASTLYHAIPLPRVKRVLRVLDHSAIFLLIAGTYTPLTLVTLRGPWGWTLFGLVWALAVVGIVAKATALPRVRVLSMVLYLCMGWSIAVAVRPLAAAMAPNGRLLLLLGGVAYTAGLGFYGWRRLPYHHMIWHLFVMAGSVLHFFAVLLYVIPPPLRAG
jgi:hemolysin III